jgi:hypothetical protein
MPTSTSSARLLLERLVLHPQLSIRLIVGELFVGDIPSGLGSGKLGAFFCPRGLFRIDALEGRAHANFEMVAFSGGYGFDKKGKVLVRTQHRTILLGQFNGAAGRPKVSDG